MNLRRRSVKCHVLSGMGTCGAGMFVAYWNCPETLAPCVFRASVCYAMLATSRRE